MNCFGIPIIENVYCTTTEPAKTHHKKRWMPEFYHNYMQKRFNKKYGMKEVPACYELDRDAIHGYGGKVIVAHPDVVKAIRQKVKVC